MIAVYCYTLIAVELAVLVLTMIDGDDNEVSLNIARIIAYIPIYLCVLGHLCGK